MLHVGNIANNAYNNAKIQRQRGIDADVVCFDYYHVMGCPEWEDAEFEGDYGDPFFPDWWAVDLHGFERPAWFAQGPVHLCLEYLHASRKGDAAGAARYQRRLDRYRWLISRGTFAARLLSVLRGVPRTNMGGTISALSFLPCRARLDYRAHAVGIKLLVAISFVRSIVATAGRKLVALARIAGAAVTGRDWRSAAVAGFPRRLAWLGPVGVRTVGLPPAPLQREGDEGPRFEPDDYASYAPHLGAWKTLFEHYDVVQAYAIDPIIPILCGVERFAAYEHGTLRAIPFEDSARGRLCAFAYRRAPVVFVTNSDVLPAARRLGLGDDQLVFLPHAVDSDRLFQFAAQQADVRPPAEVTIYSPTRHDWVDGDVSWSKGNDLFLRAAAALRDRYAFRLVLADWGRDLPASKKLIDELELADQIEWVPPLRKRELWLRYLSSHVVVDQFTVSAIGGVTFEAMALGRRVITAVDAAQTAEFFGRTPPVLAAQTVAEIQAALERVLEDPDDEVGAGRAAREWFAERHSADRIVSLEIDGYRRLLER